MSEGMPSVPWKCEICRMYCFYEKTWKHHVDRGCELKALNAEISALKARCEELEVENKSMKERGQEVQDENLRYLEHVQSLNGLLHHLEDDQLTNWSRIGQLESDLAAARHAASQWLETANERLKELEAAKEECRLSKEVREMWEATAIYRGQLLDAIRQELSETQAELEKTQNDLSLRARWHNESQQKLAITQEKLEEARKHHKYLEADSDFMREEVNSLRAMLTAQEKVVERAKPLMKDFQETLRIHPWKRDPHEHEFAAGCPRCVIEDQERDVKAFLGEIGKQ